MKQILSLTSFFLCSIIFGQSLGLSIGHANFDDTDGYNISINYKKQINKYFSLEPYFSYAKTSNFPNIHEPLKNSSNWLTKSTVANFGINAHIDFINSTKNNFSFFSGFGFANINSAESETNQYITDILFEEQNVLAKNLGIQYVYKLKKLHLGIEAKQISPMTNNDKYFGQDNYRAFNLLIRIPL